MLIIIHGDDLVRSRAKLSEFKDNFEGEVLSFSGKDNWVEATQTGSMFANTRLVIVENFFTEKKEIPNNIDNVVFWEDDEISKTNLLNLPKAQVYLFKINPKIFGFCDQLAPNNPNLLKSFRDLNEEPEFIFSMIVRQFRLMLCPDLASDWQKSKIFAQGKLFSEPKLKEVYNSLLKIDYDHKNGLTILDLSESLEHFLLFL